MTKLGSRLGRISSLYNRLEKFLVLFLFLIALVAGCWIWRQNWLSTTTETASRGGVYREGIVASSLSDVTPAINALTKVGLTQLDEDGQIQPAVAESWEISDDNKVYTFKLKDGISAELVSKSLSENELLFPNIEFEVKDNLVIFNLEQPFSPFLATTIEPIFPYGPFEVYEQKKGEVSLTPRADGLTKPFLEKIVLRVYLDSFNLTQALADGEIDGVANINDIENLNLATSLNSWTIDLPRKIYLFFNTKDEQVSDADLRRRLNNGDQLTEEIDLVVTTLANPKHESLAASLVNQWSPLGVNLKIETFTATELANDIVPNRNYQLLIYGLDFGGDPDPYPFWHSSQISESGLNLANFANIDADRILEKARQTNDNNERISLYSQFDEIFSTQVPAIELEQITASFGTAPNLKGVKSLVGLSSADRFKYVEDWYLQTKRVSK